MYVLCFVRLAKPGPGRSKSGPYHYRVHLGKPEGTAGEKRVSDISTSFKPYNCAATATPTDRPGTIDHFSFSWISFHGEEEKNGKTVGSIVQSYCFHRSYRKGRKCTTSFLLIQFESSIRIFFFAMSLDGGKVLHKGGENFFPHF